jgi:release factor glutamine methyltransferase
MTISEWLLLATEELDIAGIGTSRLDALVLLEDASGEDRAKLLAKPDSEMSSKHVARLAKLLNRRAQHEPLAYIRGHTEFYGKKFVISPAVLEPRPESETMIDLLKRLPDIPPKACLADVGTGSGALGITAKLALPELQIELLDIDEAALEIAQINVDKYTINVSVTRSDLLEQSGQDNDILLCNLPYVPDDHQINQAASQEPRIAIFGGADGLDPYRRLFKQVDALQYQPLYILSEALPNQHNTLKSLAEAHDYCLKQADDFIQVFKKCV